MPKDITNVTTTTIFFSVLNIANQTSLAARPGLVDDDLSTHVELSQLYSEDAELYDLTSPDDSGAHTLPRIHEIRIITGGLHDLDGRALPFTIDEMPR